MGEKVMFIDPITRIEGHLGLRAVVDTDTRQVSDAWAFAAMFRGFEVFLRGRELPDAIHITSRICGVCAASHSNASVIANDMALGAVPYPFGVAIRNLAWAATDHMYDHPTHLNILAGPDYSAAIVGRFTPSVLDEARQTHAERSDIHGFSTIGDLLEGLNPLQGKIYITALKMQKVARQAGVLLYGRHPHPSTLVPGGIGTTVTPDTLIEYSYRLTKLTAWMKMVVAIWDDIADFFNENGYERQGLTYERPNLLSVGLFEDPETYSSMGESYEEIYHNMDEAAEKRWVKPGLILDGELVSTKHSDMNVGTIEVVDYGFYRDWESHFVDADPNGTPVVWGNSDLAKYHPWNKTTIPNPVAQDWASKYTWAGTVRYVKRNGEIRPLEVGPIARMWATALAMGGSVRFELPRTNGVLELPEGTWGEMEFEWRPPRVGASTTVERMRARAYNVAYDAAGAWNSLVLALGLVKSGNTAQSRPWKQPSHAVAIGFNEAPRGSVRHWMVVDNYKITNYQIHAPTTANLSPRDRWGIQGPYEMSVIHSVVTEEGGPDEWSGLDFVRAIRSFDPCLACTVHIFAGSRKIERLINPACGL